MNEFALVGFEDVAFLDEVIQLARFDALTENIVVFPPEPGATYNKEEKERVEQKTPECAQDSACDTRCSWGIGIGHGKKIFTQDKTML